MASEVSVYDVRDEAHVGKNEAKQHHLTTMTDFQGGPL